jgi:hypothetical protein
MQCGNSATGGLLYHAPQVAKYGLWRGLLGLLSLRLNRLTSSRLRALLHTFQGLGTNAVELHRYAPGKFQRLLAISSAQSLAELSTAYDGSHIHREAAAVEVTALTAG